MPKSAFLVSPRRRDRVSVAAALVLALTWPALAQAQGRPQESPGESEAHRARTLELLETSFEVTAERAVGKRKLKVGKKSQGKQDKGQKEFAVDHERDGKKVRASLSQGKGAKAGPKTDFAYDEEQRSIQLASGGVELPIRINPDNTVTAGEKSCDGNDIECIGDAVMAAMPDLEAEEMAAMLAVLNDDLHEMANGEQISATLFQIAARLQQRDADIPEGGRFAPAEPQEEISAERLEALHAQEPAFSNAPDEQRAEANRPDWNEKKARVAREEQSMKEQMKLKNQQTKEKRRQENQQERGKK